MLRSWLSRWFGKNHRPGRKLKPLRRDVGNASPSLEALEDRTAPALFSGIMTTDVGGDAPCSQAVGDFNKDGKPDLVVADINSNSVSILLGNGAGGFATPTTYAVSTSPQAVVAADFDKDGIPRFRHGRFERRQRHARKRERHVPVRSRVRDRRGSAHDAGERFQRRRHCRSALTTISGFPLGKRPAWNRDRQFQPGDVRSSFTAGPQSIGAADFDKDGKMDLVVGTSGFERPPGPSSRQRQRFLCSGIVDWRFQRPQLRDRRLQHRRESSISSSAAAATRVLTWPATTTARSPRQRH